MTLYELLMKRLIYSPYAQGELSNRHSKNAKLTNFSISVLKPWISLRLETKKKSKLTIALPETGKE